MNAAKHRLLLGAERAAELPSQGLPLAPVPQSQLARVPKPSAESVGRRLQLLTAPPYPAPVPSLRCTDGFGDGAFPPKRSMKMGSEAENRVLSVFVA